MENQTMKTAAAFVLAIQQGNTAQLAELLHPDVKWYQPGNNCLTGTKENRDEVFGMVGKMFAISGNTLALTDIKFLAQNGDSVACLLHFTATRDGVKLDVDNIDVYTVRNGQIVEAKIYSEDIDQEDLFWGR